MKNTSDIRGDDDFDCPCNKFIYGIIVNEDELLDILIRTIRYDYNVKKEILNRHTYNDIASIILLYDINPIIQNKFVAPLIYNILYYCNDNHYDKLVKYYKEVRSVENNDTTYYFEHTEPSMEDIDKDHEKFDNILDKYEKELIDIINSLILSDVDITFIKNMLFPKYKIWIGRNEEKDVIYCRNNKIIYIDDDMGGDGNYMYRPYALRHRMTYIGTILNMKNSMLSKSSTRKLNSINIVNLFPENDRKCVINYFTNLKINIDNLGVYSIIYGYPCDACNW